MSTRRPTAEIAKDAVSFLSFSEKLARGWYSGRDITAPERLPERPRLSGTTPSVEEVRVYQIALANYEANLPIAEALWVTYKQKVRERSEVFYDEALVEIGWLADEMASKLYSKAYEMGHSAGYSEVYCYMVEFDEIYEIWKKVKYGNHT